MSDMISKLEHQEEPIPHGPRDPEHINPKLASDIHYWAKEFGITGQLLHEAIRVHGIKVEKVRAALQHNQVSLT